MKIFACHEVQSFSGKYFSKTERYNNYKPPHLPNRSDASSSKRAPDFVVRANFWRFRCLSLLNTVVNLEWNAAVATATRFLVLLTCKTRVNAAAAKQRHQQDHCAPHGYTRQTKDADPCSEWFSLLSRDLVNKVARGGRG